MIMSLNRDKPSKIETQQIYLTNLANLVPRALFPGSPAPKAREKRPGDEVET